MASLEVQNIMGGPPSSHHTPHSSQQAPATHQAPPATNHQAPPTTAQAPPTSQMNNVSLSLAVTSCILSHAFVLSGPFVETRTTCCILNIEDSFCFIRVFISIVAPHLSIW